MSDQLLHRYLLGDLSEEERTRIEERVLADEDYYRHLLIIEDELRIAYARRSLSAADRQRFEERFLIFADEQDKVETATAMIDALASMPASGRQRPAFARLAIAAGVILAAGVVAWLAVDGRRARSEMASLQAEQASRERRMTEQLRDERSRREQLDRELQEERRTRAALEQELTRQRTGPGQDRATSGPILSLLLSPGLVRSAGDTKTVTLPNDASALRLMLALDGQAAHRAYEVAVLNADGVRVWGQAGIPPGQQLVIVTVPARLLAEDDYELTLSGVTARGQNERVGQYYFRVLK